MDTEYRAEYRARPYHFSGNYDCTSCGRVNMPHGIIIYRVNHLGSENYWGEHCPGCIFEIGTQEEQQAWRVSPDRIEEGKA